MRLDDVFSASKGEHSSERPIEVGDKPTSDLTTQELKERFYNSAEIATVAFYFGAQFAYFSEAISRLEKMENGK